MNAKTCPLVQDEVQRRAEQSLTELRLPANLLSELMDDRHSLSFRRGDPIFLRGSPADIIYLVVSGLVKVYGVAPNGRPILVNVVGPGDFIGFVGSLEATGRHVQAFQAQAMTNGAVAIFTRDRVLTLLRTLNNESLVSLLDIVNSSWCSAFSWQIGFLGLSLSERLRFTFQHLARRFGARDSRGVLLTVELSHDDLAEMIASSRAMVSRLIAELIEEGILARHGRQYILLHAGEIEANGRISQQ